MQQARAELLGQGLVAMIATEQPDGRPHLAPIWFSWEGARFEILTPPSSRKYQNLQRRPRCTISVDDRIWPYQALTAECDLDGTREARGYPEELVRRYLSDELAPSFLDDYGDTALMAVRLRPTRWYGYNIPG
ncbi:MAG: pyridoxamine 5'-phosphate oxidase family protein [Actinomycetota bacterium]|nr:pyridoxamine 5'-phosphate oxidase family protein [Actinomycetota bacterium]